METPNAIEMKGVCFSYDNVPVLEDVGFTLKQGDFMALIGPNGGGKTTLLKLLLGILKPDKGVIKVLGEPPHDTKNRVGYLPQNTGFNTAFPITVMELAIMGRLSGSRIGRWYSKDDHAKAKEALKKVGMWEYRFSQIGKLSGGQRHRVFIARALVTDPEILLLDEPTAGVDSEFGVALYDLLKELNKRVTIVVITHDIGIISSYIKSVACINRTLIFHERGEITTKMIDMAYQCPVDLIAHGMPHRVLHKHMEK
ncbi:MAG: ABC transporter [Desulfobacteraceae bacterium 4484_190.1]|nr:MAG: ABC transporter [Desulfobacteraceae bacterium 4484_190.1]